MPIYLTYRLEMTAVCTTRALQVSSRDVSYNRVECIDILVPDTHALYMNRRYCFHETYHPVSNAFYVSN